MSLLLLFVILFVVLAALPVYPYSRSWGYYPSGGLGTLFVILLLLMLLGRI